MPTALVVTVLLTHRGRGLSRKDLIAKFEWLRNEITKRGGKVATPDVAKGEENTGKLIDSAISVLGNLVGKQKNVLEPVYTPNHRFELSLYRNQIIHLFVNDGLVACGIYSYIKHNPQAIINKKDLLADVAFLSSLLKLV
jgi:glycerol-3-phosphate O-acyltransferase